MSKENTELAKKIVDQLAIVTEVEAFDTEVIDHRDDDDKELETVITPAKHNAFCFEIPQIGLLPITLDGPIKTATAEMVERVATMFNQGDIVLADDWAANNLG